MKVTYLDRSGDGHTVDLMAESDEPALLLESDKPNLLVIFGDDNVMPLNAKIAAALGRLEAAANELQEGAVSYEIASINSYIVNGDAFVELCEALAEMELVDFPASRSDALYLTIRATTEGTD